MGIFGTLKKWIWGDEQVNDNDVVPATQAVVRSLPVLSDALSSPIGGLQGLAWFLGSLVYDDWGHLANEIFETSEKGTLRQVPGRVVKPQHVSVECAVGVISVRLNRPGSGTGKAQEGTRPPNKTKSKSKGRSKGKSRDKKR